MSIAKPDSDPGLEPVLDPLGSEKVEPPPPTRLIQAIALFRFAMGMLCVGLGIIGSLLPILQGWIFFVLALVMFFPDDPRVEKVLQKADPRFPRLVKFLRRIGVGTQDTTRMARVDVLHPHE